MNEKIKKALGAELAEQVANKLGDNGIEIGITNDGTLVPAEKHDGMKAELLATQKQLEDLQGSLKTAEGKDQTIEDLQKKLTEATEAYETFKADTAKREVLTKKKQALYKELESAGAIKSSIDLLAGTVDLEALNLDNAGKLVDATDLIAKIKTEREGLFAEIKVDGDKPPANQTPPKGNYDKMTDQEYFNTVMKKGE